MSRSSSSHPGKVMALLSALFGFFLGVVLPALLNSNNSIQAETEHSLYHETRVLEEEEDENPVLEYTIVVGIVLLLILLTILFEYSKDYLEETSSRNMRPIVESLFGELTVLGFLSIFTFVITKAGFFMRLGERLFGEERHEELLEVFESVHYTIFFIMVFFVIQVLVLVKEANQTEHEWLDWERVVTRNTSDSTVWSQRAVQYEITSAANVLIRWIQSYKYIFPCFMKDGYMDREHVLLLYKALRDEFVLDRELEHPFQPADDQVSDEFNFGRYLGVCQSSLLQKVVHVKISTWVLFAVGVVVYYLFVLLVDCNSSVIAWTWVVLAWFLCLYNVHFERHLLSVIQAFACKRVYYMAHAAQNQNGQQAEEQPEMDETSALLQESADAAANGDHLLPDWCRVDVEKYIASRPWLTRMFVGGAAIPNRQQALYWMDRKGPPLYLFILQFDLLFCGIFAAMQFVSVGPYMHHNKPLWQFLLYATLATLPILNLVVNKRRLVAVLTPVCSLGCYRRPQVIANVIRENKTVQGIRTFIVVYKLRRFAQQACAMDSQPNDDDEHHEHVPYSQVFDQHEIAQVAKTFDQFDLDGSGSIELEEFSKLMSRLGADLSEEHLSNVVASLDTDKSGGVDKEEFIQWYADHSQDDDISEEEFAHFMFHMFDENESGELTIGEFKKKLEHIGTRMTVDEIGMLVNELDTNNGGTICEEEFEHLIHKYYPKELGGSRAAHGHH